MTNIDYHNSCYDLPLFTGEVLRDEGIAKVSDHSGKWMELCILEVEIWRMDDTFTGEDIRHHCSYTVGLPKHPNAFGALVNTLVRRKIIKHTGEYRAMRDSSSHARRTPVYTKAL